MALQYSYDNLKAFDKRVATESKKAKDLSIAMDKVRLQLEQERKTYCDTLTKQLLIYENHKSMHNEEFKRSIAILLKKLSELDRAYSTAISQIANVPYSALGSLPKKYESHKKLIKTGEKNPNGYQKIKDFEYDRIETFNLALLHFINAHMYLHAKALEIFAEVYDTLAAMKGPAGKVPIKQAIQNRQGGAPGASGSGQKPPTQPPARR